MKKYKLEAEFCEEIMPLILGGLIDGRTKINAQAEVPRFSGNNHMDMILIARQQVMGIELKLGDLHGLRNQCGFIDHIPIIGLINKTLSEEEKKHNAWIFGYTGRDSELENIIDRIRTLIWTSIYESNLAGIYYWGYLGEPSNIKGGFANCKRISFFQLYTRAIQNLMIKYGRIDFYTVYRILGYYSVSTAKKYYKEALKQPLQLTI